MHLEPLELELDDEELPEAPLDSNNSSRVLSSLKGVKMPLITLSTDEPSEIVETIDRARKSRNTIRIV